MIHFKEVFWEYCATLKVRKVENNIYYSDQNDVVIFTYTNECLSVKFVSPFRDAISEIKNEIKTHFKINNVEIGYIWVYPESPF